VLLQGGVLSVAHAGDSLWTPFLGLLGSLATKTSGGMSLLGEGDASSVGTSAFRLADAKSSSFYFSHGQQTAEAQFTQMNYAHPILFSKMGWGMSYARYTKGQQEGRDENGVATGDFDAVDEGLSLSLAKGWGRFQTGLTVRRINSRAGRFEANVLQSDVTVGFCHSPKTRWAGGLLYLGGGGPGDGKTSPPPTAVAVSVSHAVLPHIVLNAEGQANLNNKTYKFSIGGEWVLSRASLRTAYQWDSKTADQETANIVDLRMGVGVDLFQGTRLDYAYVPLGETSDLHAVGLVFKF